MGVIEASDRAWKVVQMINEKQGAAEWLRGIVDEYEAEGARSCGAMAKMFGIECEYETCRSCMVKMMTAIADRIESERSLPEGIEWPRFKDGELVKIGDEVGYGDKAWKVDAICFDRVEWSMALSRNLDISRMSGGYSKRVKRPTPKVLGADGEPIEVGDTVYCDGEDDPLKVESFDDPGCVYLISVKDSDGTYYTVEPSCLSHERPDSWERLEQDARGGATGYARDVLGVNVLTTPTSENREVFARDLVRRAKALAKGDQR